MMMMMTAFSLIITCKLHTLRAHWQVPESHIFAQFSCFVQS